MYRLFVKEPDEIKGHRVGDYQTIKDVRYEVEDLLLNAPEGTQAYVYRQSIDEEGRGWGPIRRAEAYEVRSGRAEKIFTRWTGGEWPVVWDPKGAADPESERFRAKKLLDRMGILDKKERRGALKEFEGTDWKASKKEFLEEGPQTYELPGEHR